ncbi:MAG: hypothetical protein KatS3mg081_2935 [Gemmatimonadales bacterium]|nr:MAG: hypothetical protein KatS3mg081_2935 [Gemmatimonadales bacterium]
MKVLWDDVNARARGLGGQLLARKDLELLARAGDLRSVGSELRRLGYLLPQQVEAWDPGSMEMAVRRTAGSRLQTLARWCGPRTAVAAVIFEDQDRRNLRALLRGAMEGAGPEKRLRCVIPTPNLTEAWLRELARENSIDSLVRLLAIRVPVYAEVVASELGREVLEPDLLRFELALSKRFAERAIEGARLAGKTGVLAEYVSGLIDLENVLTVLVAATGGVRIGAAEMFIPGGRRIGKGLFVWALGRPDVAEAASAMARALRGTPFAEPIVQHARDVGLLERVLLGARIRHLKALAIREPLGPAPLLLYHLRLQAQVADLQAVIWGAALGAPFEIVAAELATP